MAKTKQREPSGDLLVDYWRESLRPLVSLVFILPMLLIYEGGILILGPAAVHNGAAVWLRQALATLGLGQYVLLPILTCVLLLSWHYLRREPWRFPPLVLPAMLIECVVWAVGLMIVWRGATSLLAGSEPTSLLLAINQSLGQIAGYFGAGIYEELLFRLILLSTIAAVMKAAGAERRASLITAILVSSLLFSAAHYRLFTSSGEAFTWTSFIFRALAGVYFGALFTLRGFGIAAGSHALYDVFVFTRLF